MSGLTAKLVHMVNLDYADAAGKLASGEIDALFCTAGIRTAVIGAAVGVMPAGAQRQLIEQYQQIAQVCVVYEKTGADTVLLRQPP